MPPYAPRNASRATGDERVTRIHGDYHLGQLLAIGREFMVVDFEGRAVGSDHRPSAETLLHTQLYRRSPDIGCVLHTHSKVQTIASRLFTLQVDDRVYEELSNKGEVSYYKLHAHV